MDAPKPTRHRIVIVGGGAGGLPLAARLGDKLGRRGRAEITLVDRNGTHLWKPLLHEVAAGRMDADAHDVDYLALGYWHHFRFRQGPIVALDRTQRKLTLGAVDDDEGKVSVAGLRAPRFGAHLAERNAGRVVNIDVRTGQLFHGAHDLLHIVAPQ